MKLSPRSIGMMLAGSVFWTKGAFAQIAEDAAESAVNSYAERVIAMVNGPIIKLVGVAILLAGLAALLRGRHAMAMSCGAAFVTLLFLPMFLRVLGGH